MELERAEHYVSPIYQALQLVAGASYLHFKTLHYVFVVKSKLKTEETKEEEDANMEGDVFYDCNETEQQEIVDVDNNSVEEKFYNYSKQNCIVIFIVLYTCFQ